MVRFVLTVIVVSLLIVVIFSVWWELTKWLIGLLGIVAGMIMVGVPLIMLGVFFAWLLSPKM